nr:DUF2891 domain-containing protein [Stakelama flava]
MTLANLTRRWPWKPGHVAYGPEDLMPPDALHPAFYGSYDWHSCVHGWWQVLHLLRRVPDLEQAGAIASLADRTLTADAIAGEIAMFDRAGAATFERPYGWAWLLALHGEARCHSERRWAATLAPLADLLAKRMAAYLTRLSHPLRQGAHGNSAFAMLLAHHWAKRGNEALAQTIETRAADWFGADRDCQAWEPDGDAFLSPALIEAALMARLLPVSQFTDWFDGFLPRSGDREPRTLFVPVTPPDRDDAKMVHLDGLNLSRAWCWRLIGDTLPPGHATIHVAREAAASHLSQSLPHLADSYMGSHWLATFALLALGGEA